MTNNTEHKETTVGWDIGGAHLKAILMSRQGVVIEALQLPCPLWKGLEHLASAVAAILERFGPAPHHAITMTGELADLFANRSEGVTKLVAAMENMLPDGDIRFYAGARGLVNGTTARTCLLEIASANWRASADFAAHHISDGLLLDIGSTTTDIVPLKDGKVIAQGKNDFERLDACELVYTGIVRTPVMAIAENALIGDKRVPLMAELFATMADVYRLLGRLPGEADLFPAADGGSKTTQDSARRLARMVGCDFSDKNEGIWRAMAADLAQCQRGKIREAATRVIGAAGLASITPVIGAGCGRFLAEGIAAFLNRPYLSFADLIDVDGDAGGTALREMAATCAPAMAVAWLATRGDKSSD